MSSLQNLAQLALEGTKMDSDPNDSFVEFVSVKKTYDGEILVVKDLNLSINRGEFFTLLGPSGSGKTTCLMMLAGFESPTHGEIYVSNQSIKHVPPHKRGIGMVFQNYALFPHMTVKENLAFPLQARHLTRATIEEKVKRALEMVQLGDFSERQPGQLSGGQQQRVALARALVFEPDLVLMDEPLGALDKQLREHMQYEIKHLHERLNVTVVYVTHDQSEALTMSNRICVFDGGVIQQVAAPAALYEAPENSFVAQFIGENNKLSGVIRNVTKDVCEVELDEGKIVFAVPVNIGGVGAKTMLSLRPERVIINPESGSVDNQIEARIEEIIFLGDHIRTRLSVIGSDDFVVKVPNTANFLRMTQGETVRIGWAAADCRALNPLVA